MFISEKINDCDSYNKILQRSNKVIVTKKLFFDSEKLASDKDKPLLSSIADFVLWLLVHGKISTVSKIKYLTVNSI